MVLHLLSRRSASSVWFLRKQSICFPYLSKLQKGSEKSRRNMARGYLVGNPCLRENPGSLSAMHVHDMLKGESFAARLSLHSSLLPSQKCSDFVSSCYY